MPQYTIQVSGGTDPMTNEPLEPATEVITAANIDKAMLKARDKHPSATNFNYVNND